MKFQIAAIAATVLVWSCYDQGTGPITESTGTHTVSGSVVHRGLPVANAKVLVDNRNDLSSRTDPTGRFTILNVPLGTHTLSAQKDNLDSSFLASTTSIVVTGDLIVDTLRLPRGVTMYPLSAPGATSFLVRWNPTDASDFREYKLYRHTTSGLDETTGTLAHVATSIGDTQFVDANLSPFTTYYYRVYVMNDYGRLGGSNIAYSTTRNVNIAVNGSFENVTSSSSVPDYWSTWGPSGRFTSDSSTAQEGVKSLKIQLALSDWGANSWGAYQQITATMLEPGKTYRVSFWCKTDTLEQYETISCCFSKNNYWDGNQVLAAAYNFVEGPKAAGDWRQYSFSLTAPPSAPANYFLIFMLIRAGVMNYTFHFPLTAWIDNVVVEKLP